MSQPQPLQQLTTRVPTGHFLQDSVIIGRQFQYSLSVWHPANQDVFFPDTAGQFAPFKVSSITTFPTLTKRTGTLDAISHDSAVYTLVSFETVPAIMLRVPVWFDNGTDCTAILSTPDTILLKSRVQTARPDTLQLATETTLAPLRQEFNYTLLGVALLSVGLLIGVIYALFGRTIRERWRQYRLYQRHQTFINDYNSLIQTISSDTAADTANQAVVRWKRYLELLERRPFMSLTTQEIAGQLANEPLTEALREVDRMIYGGAFTDQSSLALKVLSDVAITAYQRQLNRQYQSVDK